MYNNNNKFDVDLQYGQEGERLLTWFGTDQSKVEVKTERDTWAETGNAVFEYESRGKPSGVAVTEADYWCHIFKEKDQAVMLFIFRTLELKEFLRLVYKHPEDYGARICKGGDNNTSSVILLPISQLHRIGNIYV
ncbi:hypothetical protein UFOVP157_49 [uncultured Caudovirales phage]|uniref:Uncharacterized protein n=1 Tax=uncultured Caudovirales phage TaxID=2100421 RepID=A0A6J7W9B7_9CAUD|nr:hypothetical protein UFOVP157_49 [uncultured Caudovirales phage]